MRGIVAEVLDGLFNFDSRIWRTLLPLIGRPGHLTAEFVAGRRARYLPPFRLYLVLSLVYFVLASFDSNGNNVVAGVPEADADTAASQCEWVGALIPATERLHAPTRDACVRAFADNFRTLGRALTDRIPLMIFIMIPLFAAGLKLLYGLTGRRFAEHLFFLFHLHAFVFAALICATLVRTAAPLLGSFAEIGAFLNFWLWIYVIYYGYRALRRFYGQGRGLTMLKFGLLFVGYFVLMGLTFTAGFIYTAYTV